MKPTIQSKPFSVLDLNDDVLLTLVQWFEALELLSWGMVRLTPLLFASLSSPPVDVQAFVPDYKHEDLMDSSCPKNAEPLSRNTLATRVRRYN